MAGEDNYQLERTTEETKRLSSQNAVFNRAVGYVLHPSIQRNLPSSPSVAELATGTGDFVVSLSKELPPTSRLDAFDISSDSFLPKDKLPPNITLSVSDARQPPRDELKGQYDVVCIRFLNIALTPDTWQIVAEHAWALLKPGGALQWIEGDLLQLCTPLRMEPETKTAALEKGTAMGIGLLTQLKWFVANLRSVLEQVGFRDVKHTVAASDRVAEDRKKMALLCVGPFYAILKRRAHEGGEGALTEDEVEKLRAEMIEEVENGAYVRCDMHQFVAWKPV